MKYLIVDDEYGKVAELVAYIKSVDDGADVHLAPTATEARLKLATLTFDIMIVDLNLPAVTGDVPSRVGGVELLKLMMLDKRCGLPPSVMFLTEQEDIENLAEDVRSVGGHLHKFSPGSEDWRSGLRGKIAYAKAALSRKTPEFDIAIVTALPSEMAAFLRFECSWRDYSVPRDPVRYSVGELVVGDRRLSLVMAAALRKGLASSAALADNMVSKFKPGFLFMGGICAGRRDKVGFGDVIVGDPVWDWGSGKRVLDNVKEPAFLSSPHQMSLAPAFSQLALRCSRDASLMTRLRSGWSGKVPGGELKACIGPIASGASVLADGETMEEIQRTQNRDLIGVDMEAYAVMEASNYASGAKRLGVAAIKSVCDYGDGEKGDEWQEYAAYTSAAFIIEIIKSPEFQELCGR